MIPEPRERMGIQRLRFTTRPAPVLQPIRTPLQRLMAARDIAISEARELLRVWEATDQPATADALLYAELCRTQGRADALAEAVEMMEVRS